MFKHAAVPLIITTLCLSACNSLFIESLENRLSYPRNKDLSKLRPPKKIPLIVRRYNRPNALGMEPHLFALRKELVAGKHVDDADLRAIADTGDAYAIWTYAERLYARQNPDLTFEIIEFYAKAADKGRAGGIPRIIELTKTEQFANATPDQLNRVETVLRTYALRKGDSQAALYLVQRYNLGTPFGDKSEEVVPLLETLAEGGDTRIALRLSTQILQTSALADQPDERAKARRYLKIASKADNMSVMTTAQNLLALMDRQDAEAPVTVADAPPQTPTAPPDVPPHAEEFDI